MGFQPPPYTFSSDYKLNVLLWKGANHTLQDTPILYTSSAENFHLQAHMDPPTHEHILSIGSFVHLSRYVCK